MTISFKDHSIESRLAGICKEQKISSSLIARRDLARWYWLLDDHDPLRLEHNEFLVVCSIVKSTHLFDEPSRIKKMAWLVEDCIRSPSSSNVEIERFGTDIDKLCAKLREATPLQLAGLVDRAEAYSSESIWRRKELDPNLVDTLIDGMEAALNGEYREQIDEFISAHKNISKWIIASDYSMGRPEFTHDAMAFVLIPYIAELFPPTQIEKCLPLDFKNCSTPIDASYFSYLRSLQVFNFVFLLDRSQKLFADAGIAAKGVQGSIEMMKSWPNAAEPQNAEIIRKAGLCLKEAQSKSFLRKVNEVTMLSIFGAFVGLVATRTKKLDGVLWAPDRDNMTGVWEGLSAALFQGNFHSALHRRNLSEDYQHLIAHDDGNSKKYWIDPYVRLADFLATPAASMTREAVADGKFDKCNQVLKELFTDNPRLVVQRFSFQTENDVIRPDYRLVRISKNPFPANI